MFEKKGVRIDDNCFITFLIALWHLHHHPRHLWEWKLVFSWRPNVYVTVIFTLITLPRAVIAENNRFLILTAENNLSYSGMTQIDSTAQTDLGISDHEELLLPYKVRTSKFQPKIRLILPKFTPLIY